MHSSQHYKGPVILPGHASRTQIRSIQEKTTKREKWGWFELNWTNWSERSSRNWGNSRNCTSKASKASVSGVQSEQANEDEASINTEDEGDHSKNLIAATSVVQFLRRLLIADPMKELHWVKMIIILMDLKKMIGKTCFLNFSWVSFREYLMFSVAIPSRPESVCFDPQDCSGLKQRWPRKCLFRPPRLFWTSATMSPHDNFHSLMTDHQFRRHFSLA